MLSQHGRELIVLLLHVGLFLLPPFGVDLVGHRGGLVLVQHLGP